MPPALPTAPGPLPGLRPGHAALLPTHPVFLSVRVQVRSRHSSRTSVEAAAKLPPLPAERCKRRRCRSAPRPCNMSDIQPSFFTTLQAGRGGPCLRAGPAGLELLVTAIAVAYCSADLKGGDANAEGQLVRPRDDQGGPKQEIHRPLPPGQGGDTKSGWGPWGRSPMLCEGGPEILR